MCALPRDVRALGGLPRAAHCHTAAGGCSCTGLTLPAHSMAKPRAATWAVVAESVAHRIVPAHGVCVCAAQCAQTSCVINMVSVRQIGSP